VSNARRKRRFLAAARYDDRSIDLAGGMDVKVAPLLSMNRRLARYESVQRWPRRVWWPTP
jgi:hypothetical protein